MVTDLVSRDALRARIRRTRERNFAPWSVMPPAEWAQTDRRMPDEHGATKAFSFEYAPYEREMCNELFEARNQEVVFQLYSRDGKSEVVLNALGWTIHQRPCRIGCMWPTLGQAKKWSKDDLVGALIEPTQELYELVGDGTGRRKSDNTLLH